MLDFEVIKTDDLTKLVVVDSSDWTGLTGSEMDIVLPECEAPETVSISRNLVNNISLADLAVTEDRLPDGIYEITLRDTAGTTTHQETHLRTTNLRTLRDRAFLKNIEDCDFESSLVNNIPYIDMYIDAAYAYLREGDKEKAVYHYNQAKKRIDKLLNCN